MRVCRMQTAEAVHHRMLSFARSPPNTAGGWGNLLLSVEFTVALSVLTDRALFFDWDSLACDLGDFFTPPKKLGNWGLRAYPAMFDQIKGDPWRSSCQTHTKKCCIDAGG